MSCTEKEEVNSDLSSTTSLATKIGVSSSLGVSGSSIINSSVANAGVACSITGATVS
ncbi:MAG: hypothetical protein M9916_06980 [Crocinitomicaceae bacterium]|nr:hypothetical protein [Crocinitomicaceae bacterium]